MKTSSKFLILIFLIAAATLISLMAGTTFISPSEFFDMISHSKESDLYNVFVNLRVPRVIMALIIGASLSVSGTMFQSILKNPLADPYIIGVSGGAALGATIAIVLSLDYIFIVILSFGGSLLSITFVYLLSIKNRFGTTSLILSGIALSFIMSSAVLLIYAMSKSQDVHRAVMWLMGDLSIARYQMMKPMAVICIFIIGIAMFFHKHLNIISFGDSFSRNMGVTEGSIRNIFWLASFLSAISVSLAGVVGFVGLIIPHVMRNIFGPDHIRLIPLSAIGGGMFLMVSDAIGRSIVPPYEIPVGIITGFVGGIFFLVYMMRNRGRIG